MCLNLVSQVEVLAEMLAKRRARRRGDDDDLGPTLAVEALKAALKTALWADQRGNSSRTTDSPRTSSATSRTRPTSE